MPPPGRLGCFARIEHRPSESERPGENQDAASRGEAPRPFTRHRAPTNDPRVQIATPFFKASSERRGLGTRSALPRTIEVAFSVAYRRKRQPQREGRGGWRLGARSVALQPFQGEEAEREVALPELRSRAVGGDWGSLPVGGVLLLASALALGRPPLDPGEQPSPRGETPKRRPRIPPAVNQQAT